MLFKLLPVYRRDTHLSLLFLEKIPSSCSPSHGGFLNLGDKWVEWGMYCDYVCTVVSLLWVTLVCPCSDCCSGSSVLFSKKLRASLY